MAEVEVDPETGVVEIVRYRVCDDFGKTVNPMIVRGQVHGGVAQGLGQALLERTSLRRGSGQLLSGSFMDYALPRADDLPDIEVDLLEVPSASNPLGVKGAGEAGSVGSPPAIDQRDHRCAVGRWRDAYRHAGDAGGGVEGDGAGEIKRLTHGVQSFAQRIPFALSLSLRKRAQAVRAWVPAFAGMTIRGQSHRQPVHASLRG